MGSRSGSRKKSGSTRSRDARDKDRVIAELKERVAALENELRLKHEDSSPLESAESKQVEEQLRKSEERLDFSLRSADIGAWDLNLIDHTAWRSPCHDRIFGYEEPLPEWTYEMFLDHVLPEYREYVDSRFQEAVAGHGDWDFECRIRRADGEVRWMYAHGRAVYDGQGRPLRMVGINIDTTRQKLIEEELRRTNRALRALSACKEAMIRADSEAVLLNDICRIIVDVGGYRMAWIGFIENDELRTVRPVARAGYDEGYVDNLKIALEDPVRGSGPTGISLKTGKPYGSRNIRSDEEMRPWREEALKRGYLSTLNLPVVYEKQVIGALIIYSGKVDAFDEEERGLLFELAQTLAFGITATRDRAKRIGTEEELIRVNKELEMRIDERTAKLRESEARFRALFESAGAAIFVADVATGKITDCNAKAEELIGRPREEIVGLRQTQLHPAEMAAERREAFVHNASEGGTTNYETVVQHRDGRVIPIIINATKLRIDGREIMLGFFIDITERKQAEDAIARSEKMLQLIMDNIPQAIFWKDRNSTYLGCNKVFARAAGLLTPGEVRGKTDYDLPWSREQADFFRECDRKVMENDMPEYHIDEQQREASGRTAWVETNKVPLHDTKGNVTGVLGTYEDITLRMRAEEALRESERKYRSLAEQVNDWVWEIDANGFYTYASPRVRDLLGYEPGEVVGSSPFDYMAPEESERVKALFYPILESQQEFSLLENTLIKKDGSTITVETSGLPIFDDSGTFIGYRGTDRDITERKRAEEALVEAKAQAELYVDLMGHDINNMNQVSMGFLELAHNLIEMEGRLDEENIVLLDKAMNSLNNSSQLIDNVRKLQRERMGLYRPEVLDVDRVIGDAAGHFQSIPGRDVKIVFTPREHCLVSANGLLKDVFINLIGNAVKHSKGALTVNIRVDQVTDNGVKYCRVAVEDDGPGIPNGLKNTLFDRLNLTTTRARGKGFGLCLIKMLVDDYHGRFWAEDRVPGDHTQGARFIVMLPAVEK